MKCAVVGGGITGLALGHELLSHGVEPIVFEASERAGGKLCSVRSDGFLLETGPASMTSGEPALSAMLDQLGLTPREAVPELRRWVVADRRLRPVPATALEMAGTPLLGWKSKLRLAGELLLPRRSAKAEAEESVAEFARRRLGAEAAERLLYPQISSLYAADPDALSLDSAFPWLAGLERDRRSVLTGLRARQAASLRSRLISFDDGMSALADALAARLGDRLRLRSVVTGIDARGSGYRVQSTERSVEVDSVVLASPAWASARVVRGLSREASDALEGIPYVPVTLVHLAYPPGALDVPEGYGFFVAPADHSVILGAVFVSQLFTGRAPDGTLLVSVRVGGARSPGNAALPDGELVQRVSGELAQLFRTRTAPSFTHVFRHRAALPQYTIGHRDRLAVLAAAEASLAGLFFAGSAYRGAGVPDCVRDAAQVAKKVARHLRSA